jgi:hypothetical protein
MASKNFPGPSINHLIETDPMIVKIPLDNMGWGARTSIFNQLGNDPKSQNPSKPTAPEMTVKHTSGSSGG